MPKLAKGLTDTQVRNAKANDKSYRLSDGGGLSLQVNPNGSKLWRYRYKKTLSEGMISLGSYPSVSLADARKEAGECTKLLAKGIDPSTQRKEDKAEDLKKHLTKFANVADEWFNDNKSNWAANTAKRVRGVLDSTPVKKLADIPIGSLSNADILKTLDAIAATAPRTASKAKQYFNNIILDAIEKGHRGEGSLLVIPKAKSKSWRGGKNHFPAVTDSRGLPNLLKAINGIKSLKSRTALLVCLYTASRPSTVVGMRWSEIDFVTKQWHIPCTRMKTGHSHISPLPSQLIEALLMLKESAGDSPFVFTGLRDPQNSHIHRDSLSKVLRENGLRGVTVTHGFRATFRTIAREKLKASVDVLEAQLAHAKSGEVQAAYDRTEFVEERHVLVQNWANLLEGKQTESNVVPFKQAS